MVEKVMTPVFRCSFPSVDEARSYEGGAPKFSLVAVFDPSKFTAKDKVQFAAMKALADKVSMEKFKKPVDKLPGNFKKPLRDGAEKEDLEGFGEGKWFATLSSKMRPGVVDLSGALIADVAGEIYPGCYCRATVTSYAYDNVGKGVAFGLQNIQKVKDGDRLDSRTDADQDFAGDKVDDEWLGDEVDPLG